VPREFPRSRRIEEQIQRILGDALRGHVRDPRLHGVIVTDVRVSRDLGIARIYYTRLSQGAPMEDPGPALAAAGGFLRSLLAREMRTRYVPELRFCHDESAERGAALERLIDEAVGRDGDSDQATPGSEES
jgi:ribosome-binding factor A